MVSRGYRRLIMRFHPPHQQKSFEIQILVIALDLKIYGSFSFMWKHCAYVLAHETYIDVAVILLM